MKRPILATVFRKGKKTSKRQYARITTAFPRAVQVLMETAQPGDVVEFAHADWGFQIGWVKIHVDCLIEMHWVTK